MLDPKDPDLVPPTVLLLLPCYGNQMYTQTVESLLDLQLEAYEKGVDFIPFFNSKSSLISLGRSMMLCDVMSLPNWTHVFWVDSDVGFKPEDFFKLLIADKDVVGGYYPIKNYPIKWASSPKVLTDGEVEGDLIETFYIATGFMLIKKEVIMAMYDHYKTELHFRYFDREFVHLFQPIIDKDNDDLFLSEDYAFRKRARDIGFKTWMHKGVKLSHTGSHTFSEENEVKMLAKYEEQSKVQVTVND